MIFVYNEKYNVKHFLGFKAILKRRLYIIISIRYVYLQNLSFHGRLWIAPLNIRYREWHATFQFQQYEWPLEI